MIQDVATNQSTFKEAVKERAQEATLNPAMDAINKSAPRRKANTFAKQAKKKQPKKRTNAPRL